MKLKKNVSVRYKCSQSPKCPATATCDIYFWPIKTSYIINDHNESCKPYSNIQELCGNFKETVRIRVLNETNNPLQQIYESDINEVSKKSEYTYEDLANVLPSFSSMKTCLSRTRMA